MEHLEQLISQAKSDHLDRAVRHKAFGQLVEQFQAWAFACAFATLKDNHLAQDATQEAFITAYQKLGQLQEPRAFPVWLRRIVHTQCSRLRRGKRLPLADIGDIADIPTLDLDPAITLEDNDLTERILAAIDDLPEHEQVVVRLFYLQGYSIKETAHLLNLPVTTIKKRLQYARRRLRGTVAQIYNIQMMAHYPGVGSTFNKLTETTLQLTQAWLMVTVDDLRLSQQPEPIVWAVSPHIDVHYDG